MAHRNPLALDSFRESTTKFGRSRVGCEVILMSIEIKGAVPDSVPAAEELADVLTEFGRISDVMIASFDSATTSKSCKTSLTSPGVV